MDSRYAGDVRDARAVIVSSPRRVCYPGIDYTRYTISMLCTRDKVGTMGTYKPRSREAAERVMQ